MAINHDVDEHRRCGEVVITQSVMRRLEMPDYFPSGGFKTENALGEQVVAWPMAAVMVVGGRAHRKIHIAEFLVGAHPRPYVCVACIPPRFLEPGLMAGFSG